MNARRRCRGEEGVSLILALVFLMLFSLIVGAVLTQLQAGVRTTPVVSSSDSSGYAADGGIDYGIQQLAADQNGTLCPHTDGSTNPVGAVSLNGQAVNVSCTTLSGDIGSGGVGGGGQFGASGWTVVATGFVDAANPPQWKHNKGGDCDHNALPQTDRGSMIQVFMCPGSTAGIQRTVTDAHVTALSKTVTSATAHFTTGDTGAALTGAGIAANTKIASVQNATTATMSANATATSPLIGSSLTVGAQSTGEQVIYGGTKVFNAGGFYLPYSNNMTVQGTITQYDDAGYCGRDQAFAHFPPANNTINPIVQTGWNCTTPGATAVPDPRPVVVVPTVTAPSTTNTTTCHDGTTKVNYKYPGVYTANPNPPDNTFMASGTYYILTGGETAFGNTIWGGEPAQGDQLNYDDPARRALFPGIDIWGNFVPYPAGCQRTITDGGVTSGSTTLTSTAANFNTNDVNSKVKGTGIPFGTYITAVQTTPAHSVNASVSNAAGQNKKLFTVTSGTLSQADVGATVTYNGSAPNPIPAGTKIASVTNSTTALLSANVTAVKANQPYTITPTTGPAATLSQAATVTSSTASISILNGFSDRAANAACGNCMNSYNAAPADPTKNKGLTFIMGGKTIFDIHTGELELFSRIPGTMDAAATQGTTLWAWGTPTPPTSLVLGGSYQPSLTWDTTANGGDRCNCAFVTDKPDNQIIFHGLTYTPYQPIDVYSNAGTHYSPFFGGVVANWIVTHLDTGSQSGLFAGQFGAFGTPASDRTILVTSTADDGNGKTRTSKAVVTIHVNGNPPTIKSWKNQ